MNLLIRNTWMIKSFSSPIVSTFPFKQLSIYISGYIWLEWLYSLLQIMHIYGQDEINSGWWGPYITIHVEAVNYLCWIDSLILATAIMYACA